MVASDGALEATQEVTVNVVADPDTTTRLSGVIQSVEQAPLPGVVIELGDLSTITDENGAFTLTTDGVLPDETLRVRGEEIVGEEVYPFIAEPIPLLLGREAYEGVNNVIDRPIYLPALDVANGQEIDPTQTTTVTTPNIPNASVTVAAGSLGDADNPFSGVLSITEVPVDLTPAALPPNLRPDLVVTIQPGELAFSTPAALSLPNTAGYESGTILDLWSINPTTGEFEVVGAGQVSADGSTIETISGGIRNSSWHFFAILADILNDPLFNLRNPNYSGHNCPERHNFKSDVESHSGALIDTYDLVPYQSQGQFRGLRLTYDSLRADPRPIVHFDYDAVTAANNRFLVAELSVSRGAFEFQVPGFSGGQYGLDGGEHFWRIPENGGDIDAALQVDLSRQGSGVYQYDLTTGLQQLTSDGFVGTSSSSVGELIHINSVDSVFGSGWGLAGLQQVIENDDGSVLLVDGDGTERLYRLAEDGLSYISPSGDFSRFERQEDGTFQRVTRDQTVYQFNSENLLASVEDRNNNQRNIYTTVRIN